MFAQDFSTLPSLCLKARCDIQKISQFATNPSLRTNLSAFNDAVSLMHVEWSTFASKDTCGLGGCNPNSPEVHMSLLMTAVNGLSSKLMMVKDLEVPADLQQSIKDLNIAIDRQCPAATITPADCATTLPSTNPTNFKTAPAPDVNHNTAGSPANNNI